MFLLAVILHINFLGCFLFDQLAHDRLEVLWRSQKSSSLGLYTRFLGRERELTQENHTLAVEDHHQAVLELGGQVEGEPGPGQTGPRRRDLLQHVAHDVVTARASLALGQQTGLVITETASGRSSHQVFLTSTLRKSRRGILMAFVATSLQHRATGYMTSNE